MIDRLLRAFGTFELKVAELSAIPVLAMMAVVTIDVAMRYAANAPLAWSYDLVSMYLMPAIVFPSLAYVQRRSHHVNVDLLYRRLPPAGKRAATALSLVASGGVMAIIGGLAAMRAETAWVDEEVVSGPIAWPVWIGHALLAFGAALFVLRTVAGLVETARGRVIAPGTGESEAQGMAEGT